MKNPNSPFRNKSLIALSAGAIFLSSVSFIGCRKDASFQNPDQDAALSDVSAVSSVSASARTASDVTIASVDKKTGTGTSSHSLKAVPAGALLVITTSCESSMKDATVSSSPSLAWTRKIQSQKSNSGDAEIFTAVFPAGGDISITSRWPAGSVSSVAYVIVNQESSLAGASNSATLQSSPSINLTTTKENSVLLYVTSDWKAIDGSGRSYRNAPTEALYARGQQTYATYHYYKLAGAVQPYSEGLNSPTGQQAGTCVLEVRGKSTSTTTPPPTTNQAPVINNMAAISITLPINNVTLTGIASDADGTIASYLWSKVSGTGGTITSVSAAATTVTGLTAGSYVFNLRVTDNLGATANKTVSVTVNAATTTPPPPPPPTGSYGTLQFQTGYNSSSDINTDQGIYNTISTGIYKTGPGSFRSEVKQNQPMTSSGYRSEMQYNGSTYNPTEGVIEYDVYYENWHQFLDGGHSFQWHPNSSSGGAVVSLQNYGGKFSVVRSINNNNSYGPSTLSVIPNRWYHMRWEVKWSTSSTGYVKLYIDDVLYYSFTGVTTDSNGNPYLKVGQNRWPGSGASAIRETAVVYYDNLKIWKR